MGKRWWERKNQDGKLYLFIAIILSTLMFVGGVSWIAWAGIQAENGIYGWYSTGSKWVKVGATSTGGVNTNTAGDLTAADGMANPTTAIRSGSYNFGYNGTTWDSLRTSLTSTTDNKTTGLLASGGYSYDTSNTNWKRNYGFVPGGSNALTGTWPSVHTMDTNRNYTRITTNTSTAFSNYARINKIIVSVAGTGSTVAFYNDTTVPCDTNYMFTLPTVTTGNIYEVNLWADLDYSICALTAGTAAADITLLRQ